jgi:ABC-type sugar transport system substrate-binding protein
MRAALAKQDIAAVPQVADGDANRQLEQVQNLIAQKVGGIIIAPKDGQTVLPMIKAANRANVPIVLYNRPPAQDAGKYVTVVADDYAITKATVQYMCEQAKKSGKKYKAMILIGDLGDLNAIGRRDGFADTVKQYPDVVQVISEVPTEWNQEKARAGVTNALQAHPDINFIFSSSDFLFPSVVAALKAADKYKKVGEEGHVLLGGFDGDATAYHMLADGYLDADGVQDMEFESARSVQAVQDLHAGKQVPKTIPDPGLVVTHDNLKETSARMWGANVKKSAVSTR